MTGPAAVPPVAAAPQCWSSIRGWCLRQRKTRHRLRRALVIPHPRRRSAWRTIVVRSRCPRAFTRNTQHPVSALCNVTRSMMPASTSRVGLRAGGRRHMAMGRIIPHAPGEWRARVGGGGLASGLGAKATVRRLRPVHDGGGGIPIFRLRNQARSLKSHRKKLVKSIGQAPNFGDNTSFRERFAVLFRKRTPKPVARMTAAVGLFRGLRMGGESLDGRRLERLLKGTHASVWEPANRSHVMSGRTRCAPRSPAATTARRFGPSTRPSVAASQNMRPPPLSSSCAARHSPRWTPSRSTRSDLPWPPWRRPSYSTARPRCRCCA